MDLLWNIGRSFMEVLVVGALLGAGLPALFAFGVRMLAWADGASDDHEPGEVRVRRPGARVAAYAIFALVVLIVVLGIAIIVSSGLGIDLELGAILR